MPTQPQLYDVLEFVEQTPPFMHGLGLHWLRAQSLPYHPPTQLHAKSPPAKDEHVPLFLQGSVLQMSLKSWQYVPMKSAVHVQMKPDVVADVVTHLPLCWHTTPEHAFLTVVWQ
jgi:hypothetical protein